MPPPVHANLHHLVPSAPALLAFSELITTVAYSRCQKKKKKTDTCILPGNVTGQSVCLSSTEAPGYRHRWGWLLVQININPPQNAAEGRETGPSKAI